MLLPMSRSTASRERRRPGRPAPFRWERGVGSRGMPDPTLSDVITARMRESGHDQIEAPVAAAKVCITLARLAKAAHDLRDWPTQARYADYWGITERQAQRE